MKKRILIPISAVFGVLLLLWAPWISQDFAQQRAEQAFTASWQGVIDGCGLNCKGCGAKETRKSWAGVLVEIEYACGMLPEDSPQYHKQSTGYVSFLGTVHGLPRP